MMAGLAAFAWSFAARGSTEDADDTVRCASSPLVLASREQNRDDCVFVDLQTAGRAYASVPDAGVSRGVALTRARAELGIRARDVSARIALNAVRSSGEQGYLGIDGEAYVPEFRVAEARVDLPDLGFSLAAGLVDDPYTMSIQPVWLRRDLLPTLATDQGYLDRSDIGGWLGWSSSDDRLSAVVAVTSGEGANRRERNDGVNTTGVVHLRPRPSAQLSPEIVLLAREGSRGIGRAPDHRAGAALLLHHPYGAAGAEILAGWGLQGDGTRRPIGGSVWLRTADSWPIVGAIRTDLARDDRTAADANEWLLLVSAGPTLPFVFDRPLSERSSAPIALLAGLESRQYGSDARPIAGAEAYAHSHTVFLMLSAILRGGVPFESR